jgi:DHA1 family inner membrane transport protein
LAQFVLGLGGLFIGTGEFAAMGLLPDFARSVHVSIPQAGSLISAYALGVVVGSPLLAVLCARMERRRLLVLLSLIVLVGNIATALAPSFALLAGARFLAGLPHGAYYGTASIVAAAMAPHGQRAQAIGRVMLGLAVANVVGVPLTTWLGQTLGWHAAFASIGLGGALLAVLLPLTVPQLEANVDASPLGELSALANRQVWLTLATATIGFAGMFAVYSYITPTLTQVTGEALARVPFFLALLGLGMVVGNIAGGWLTDRAQSLTILLVQLWNAACFALFALVAHAPLWTGLAMLLIGIGFAAVPALQARLMDVAPRARAGGGDEPFGLQPLQRAGRLGRGRCDCRRLGLASTGFVAAALACGGLIIFLMALWTGKPVPSPKGHSI